MDALPNVKKTNLGFSETGIEQEDEVDPAWPHIQGIYELGDDVAAEL